MARSAPGPAEQGLLAFGAVYAAVARTAVLGLTAVLAPIAAGPDRWSAAAVAAAVAIGWSVVYTRALLRRPGTRVVLIDVALMTGLCLTAPWTVPPGALLDGTSWVLAAASVSVVAYQWFAAPVVGAGAAVVVAAAHVWGVGALDGPSFGIWMLAEAALSRTLFTLVRRAGRAADHEAAEQEGARRTAAVAVARRADEREHLALLHDTAAATLLMVGSGAVAGRRSWLSEQAARDLSAIASGSSVERADGRAVECDLRTALRHVTAEPAGVPVDLQLPPTPVLVTQMTAHAACSAVREALTNVARHAPGHVARVAAVVRPGGGVRVWVADDGPGFDPARHRPGRRGLTGSIIGRTEAAGGTAAVESAPGRGTVVRLEWPAP